MNILTIENTSYNIDNIPDEIGDVRFCILDLTKQKDIDYYYLPLIFLESFYAPAAVLKIGELTISMPLDWSILVCDEEMNEVDVMPITRLNDRGFKCFSYNPFSDMIPKALDIDIINVYNEVKWFFPKLKNGTMLVTPLDNRPKPPCGMFVKELAKLPKTIDIGELF